MKQDGSMHLHLPGAQDREAEALLPRVAEIVADRMGLHFPASRHRDLQRGIASAAREFGFEDAAAFPAWLASAPLTTPQIEILASHLTVGETYFFREGKSFDALEHHVLPKLIRSRQGRGRRLRVWSAGCCTGEEAYSIAILLSRVPDLKDWHVTVLATDINPRFLQKAQAGVYGEWSFRSAPPWLQDNYFQRTANGRFEISPGIKERVNFSYLNLAEDIYPSLSNGTNAMDIILCRNVLMYFSAERAGQVVGRFHHALADGGWLIVSPTEVSRALLSGFATVNFPGVILHRKGSGATPVPVPVLPAPAWNFPTLPPVADALPLQAPPPQHALVPPNGAAKERPVPKPQPAPYEVALALYGQGRYSEAEKRLQDAGDGDGQTAALLARICANQGRLAEALAWCEKAVAADALNPAHHYLVAAVLQEQGDAAKASAALRRALYLEPGFVLAHFAFGNLRLRQGQSREARRHFENAHEILDACAPGDPVPESEGITAGRLSETITALIHTEALP